MAAAEPELKNKVADPTVNPDEVAYYSRLASTWWDVSGPFWPLHKLNGLRVEYLREQLCRHFGRDTASAEPLLGLKIVDVGCGGGILSESMARLGANVTGIDVVEKNLAVASLHAKTGGLDIDYKACAAKTLADSGASFDIVLNMEVVEHVADVSQFMDDCTRLTRPGGVMFVATINRTWRSWLFAIVGAEYVLRWLPRGTHRWRDFRKPFELEALLEQRGMTVLRRTGVRVNPLTRSFSLMSNLAVNFMLMATKP